MEADKGVLWDGGGGGGGGGWGGQWGTDKTQREGGSHVEPAETSSTAAWVPRRSATVLASSTPA